MRSEAFVGSRQPGAAITRWRVDAARYACVPILSDGKEGAPPELRPLFEQFQFETGHGS